MKANLLYWAPAVAVAAFLVPSFAVAGPACTGLNPGDAPTGCIFDLDTTAEAGGGDGTVLSTYTTFTTSFTADATSEFVSFAFRESPAYFSFDDACVTAGALGSCTFGGSASATNLLSDPLFQGSAVGENCNDQGSGQPCPPSWGAWIQSVDTEAIGEIVGPGSTGGCGNPGTAPGDPTANWWCDGSVQGYDALYQQLSGLTVGTVYNISWILDDNSGSGISETPGQGQIDMLVYAGDQLPVGSIPIGTAPEPATFALVGLGLVGAGVARARNNRKKA
jgi:hypothetical protein